MKYQVRPCAGSCRRPVIVQPCQSASRGTQPAEGENTHGDVNDVDDVVGELARVVRGEVVAAALHEEQLARVLGLQRLERAHVRADVLADRGVRAAARLDSEDARCGERLVPDEELLVLAREDVVRDRRCSAHECEFRHYWVRDKNGAPMLYCVRRRRQSSSVSAVLPEPTGLLRVYLVSGNGSGGSRRTLRCQR